MVRPQSWPERCDGAIKKLNKEVRVKIRLSPELISFINESSQRGVMETPPEPEED